MSRAKIVVPQLSRIANFDDFDPLREEPEVELVFVPPGRPLPRDAALIVIPGTKSTIADMEFVRSQGWDVDILSHVRHGGRVLGICGGYQMLGRTISDPNGIEGPPRTVPGPRVARCRDGDDGRQNAARGGRCAHWVRRRR